MSAFMSGSDAGSVARLMACSRATSHGVGGGHDRWRPCRIGTRNPARPASQIIAWRTRAETHSLTLTPANGPKPNIATNTMAMMTS